MTWLDGVSFWGWAAVGLILLVVELLVSSTFFLWLGVSALVTGLLLFLMPGMIWQLQFLLFSVLSVVSIYLSRRYLARNPLRSEQPALNRRSTQYIGRRFTLVEPIAEGYGMIVVDDSRWKVHGPDLPVGSRVRVVGAQGSLLEVETDDS